MVTNLLIDLLEGLKELIQFLRNKCLIIMPLMLLLIIGLAINVKVLQHEYQGLAKEYFKYMDAYEICISHNAPTTKGEPAVFIPMITSDVTILNTAKDMISKVVMERGLYIDTERFYELAVKYQIDPGFALAIWAWETGWGISDAWNKQSNPAGIRCGIEYCTYSNKDEGLEAMFSLLHKYTQGSISYIGHRKTPQDIRGTWSETDDVVQIVDIWRSVYGSC